MTTIAAERLQRSVGEVRVRLGDGAGRPQLVRAFQEGSGKLRFASAGEILILNTSGGLASGDRFTADLAADAHTLTVSTVACERVYRAEGPPATVRQSIAVAAGAHVRQLPQPTILFEGARLDRRTRVDLAEGAALTLCEGIVLGREAMGEAVTRATVGDRVEVRIGGRLAFVDALRLTPEGLARLATPAGLGAARGIGLVVHRSADLAAALERARAVEEAAATIVSGVLVARLLAPSHTRLQDGLARLVTALDGTPPPRSWLL